jgi:cell wall-associated NlpC family hydrolase
MSQDFDPRVTPVRDDLAAAMLKDTVERPRYVSGTARQVSAPALALSFTAKAGARLETERLLGEGFTVYDEAVGWAWGQAAADGYVGYVPAAGLEAEVESPSHVVQVPASHLYPEPDPKCPPTARLSLECRVRVTAQENGFAETTAGGWIFAKHLTPVATTAADYVETARGFLGVPYLWGGRTSLGLDCSALIQLSLQRAGLAAPRDTDQQAEAVGEAIGGAEALDDLRQGDLVYFPGHAGIVLDGWRLLHANAFHMAVVVEGLSEVLDRANASGQGVSTIRRIWTDSERRAEARQ